MISHNNFQYLKDLEDNISDLEYMVTRLEEDGMYSNHTELTLHTNALSAIKKLLNYKVNRLNSLLTED